MCWNIDLCFALNPTKADQDGLSSLVGAVGCTRDIGGCVGCITRDVGEGEKNNQRSPHRAGCERVC